jgi:hypothetical protein
MNGRSISLMEGVLRAMFLTKVRLVVVLLLATAVLGVGVGLWLARPEAALGADRRQEAARATPRAEELKPPAREGLPARPVGRWERTMGNVQILLVVEGDRLRGTYTETDKGAKVTMTLEADYSVTKDHVLFGVITGVEMPAEPNQQQNGDGEAELLDQPFSVRYRVDDDTLTIKDVKVMGSDSRNDKGKEFRIVCGRYKRQAVATAPPR